MNFMFEYKTDITTLFYDLFRCYNKIDYLWKYLD